MKILVTGANGFVGSALCRELLRRGHNVAALARTGADTTLVPVHATIVRGDFHRRDEIAELLSAERPDAVIHAAAVVSSGTPNLEESLRINVEGSGVLADESRRARVQRLLLISSMSAHPDNKSIYGGTKLLSEEAVRRSGIAHTILRPSLVYGPQRRGIFFKLTGMMKKLPLVPLIGTGGEPLRPVHVEDLAWVAAEAVERDRAEGETMEVGGATAMTFREMLAVMRRELGRPALFVPMPLPLCRLMAVAGECVLDNPPVTSDNIEGIRFARPVDNARAEGLLGYRPRDFREGFADCLKRGLV